MSALFNKWSLSARLTALGLIAALALTSLGSWMLRQQLHDVVIRSFESSLQQRVERLSLELLTGSSLDTQVAISGLSEFSQIFSGWYWILQTSSEVRRSRSLWDANLPVDRLRVWKSSSTLLQASAPTGGMLLGVRLDTPFDGGSVLYVFGSADDVLSELRRIDRVVLVTQLVFITALLCWILIQVYLGLLPLRRLRQRLLGIQSGGADNMGQSYGPDLNPVAAIIDSVLERNNRVVNRARHQAADLSHALKKPLALLGVSARGSVTDSKLVREQVHHMSDIIDRHLTRFGSSAGSMQVVDVAPMVCKLLDLMKRIHHSRKLDWRFEPEQHTATSEGLRWVGAGSDMEEMLGNLLDNAGKWADSAVSVSLQRHAAGVMIIVEDDGPGMDTGTIKLAAERGRRFDESIEGHGLGLAIVRDLADTYEGQLILERSELGGLRCCLMLP